MAAFLEIFGISKHFGARPVLQDVSLHVEPGEMLCILGPSGCGKTTLLRIIAGLESADQGTVTCQGKDIGNLPPEKRHFGFVFQNYALFPNLRIDENIAYGLQGPAWPTGKRNARVEELLTLVGLSDHARMYPGQLSGGQQQRIALARALAPDPTLLLLDEPLSALDAQVRASLREELRKLQQQLGITAILVTHDQQEALALADRIVIMQGGHIEQIAPPDILYQKPKTRFVAEFIGAMNVLSLPDANRGKPFGIRYEDVLVIDATETILKEPHTFVARIESTRLFGSFRRLELLFNDQSTCIYADIPSSHYCPERFAHQGLVAVNLPQDRWCVWER